MTYARQGNLFGSPVDTMTPNARRAIAFHESGHAVALELTGGRVEEVRCEVHHPIPVHHVKGTGWTPEAVLAGIVAEKWTGRAWLDPVAFPARVRTLLGWGPDLARWRRMAPRGASLRRAIADTERLLAPHRGTVEALASELLERECLDGDELRAVLAEVFG